MFLNGYPYTDFHEMNLDFLLKSMEELKKAFSSFTASNSLIFAEPLLHDNTKSYAKNTIVLDPDGNAFISLQAVPAGVQLSNADYWLMVFNFEDYTEKANKNFTVNYLRDTTRAPQAYVVGDWLVLDDVLYKVTAAIAADDLFEIGTNIVHFTIEQFLKDFITSINQTVLQYKNDIDASELAYRQQLAQDIATTTASLQAQLDTAISGATADSEVINARVGWLGDSFPTLRDSITGQVMPLITSIKNQNYYTKSVASANYVHRTINNSTGAPAGTNNDFATILDLIDCTGASTITLKGRSNITNLLGTYVYYYQADDTFISVQVISDENPASIPAGAAKFRYIVQGSTQITDYTNIIENLSIFLDYSKSDKDFINELQNSANELEVLTTSIKNQNYFNESVARTNYTHHPINNTTGVPMTSENYTMCSILDFIDCTGKSTITLKGRNSITNILGSYVYYYQADDTFISVQVISDENPASIPANAAKFRYIIQGTTDIYDFTDIISKLSIFLDYQPCDKDLILSNPDKIVATVSADGKSIAMNSELDGVPVIINFGIRGINNVADFKSIVINGVTYYGGHTDYISPFVVAAKSNIDGDQPTSNYFTGGNHGYDNTGTIDPSNSATARTDNLKFIAGGAVLSASDVVTADSITITFDDFVQAYNTTKSDGTGREVLKIHYECKYNGKEFIIYSDMTPLEDVTMQTMYGCDMNVVTLPNLTFMGATNRTTTVYTSSPDSGNKKPNGVHCSDNTYYIELLFDVDYDLGNRDFISASDPGMFTAGNKVYGSFIHNHDLDENEHYYLKSIYKIGVE